MSHHHKTTAYLAAQNRVGVLNFHYFVLRENVVVVTKVISEKEEWTRLCCIVVFAVRSCLVFLYGGHPANPSKLEYFIGLYKAEHSSGVFALTVGVGEVRVYIANKLVDSLVALLIYSVVVADLKTACASKAFMIAHSTHQRVLCSDAIRTKGMRHGE